MKTNYLRIPEMVLAEDKPGPVHLGLNIQTYSIALTDGYDGIRGGFPTRSLQKKMLLSWDCFQSWPEMQRTLCFPPLAPLSYSGQHLPSLRL